MSPAPAPRAGAHKGRPVSAPRLRVRRNEAKSEAGALGGWRHRDQAGSWFRRGSAEGGEAGQGLSRGSQPLSPRPPRSVRRADGAEHRHRAAAGGPHGAAHRRRRRRQRARQGGLLQPQVPARGLLLRWVRPAGRGSGGGVPEGGAGRGRPKRG